jgi:putative endonuclease
MDMDSKTKGMWGEDIAARYLSLRGYAIVARNWQCREGEIDIIAYDETVLSFVEVKLRSEDYLQSPEEAITAAKKRRLESTIYQYLAQLNDDNCSWRVDMIAIVVARATNRVYRIDLYQDIFQLDGKE